MTIDYDFHNPDNLTPTQVGDGYRLLLKSEIKKRAFSREIQKWDRLRNDWCKDSLFLGSNKAVTYRVPLATWPLPEADYACPPVKHPEAQELQDRFAEPEWIPWHGGECPLKDDEVAEWEYESENGYSPKSIKAGPPSLYKNCWRKREDGWGIIAYRVLKWKRPPTQTNLPPESCPVCGASEVASNGPRITYACGSSDYDQRPGTFKQASSCLPSVKEPAPTDNDTWNSLLNTNAQLGKKVAELEDWKNQVEFVESEWNSQEVAKLLDLPIGKSIRKGIMEQLPLLLSKLTTAEARLKQLEWVPFSKRKPTRKDANEFGWLCATDGKHTCQFKVQNLSIDKRWTHWRPFAPPTPIDTDRVEFEKWWKSHRHTYTTTGKEAVYEIWKAARLKEAKP